MSITSSIVSITMHYSTTLTQKGQVTIPVEIRRSLGLKTGQKVAFVTKGDDVVIKPAKDFLSLKGSVSAIESVAKNKKEKKKKRYSDDEADKAMKSFMKKMYFYRNLLRSRKIV